MGMISEFKEFAMRGNVMDMAVGVVMGGAFGKIVTALVEKIMMPIVGAISGGVDFAAKSVTVGEGEMAADIQYGAFIQATIDFLIIAFCIFLMVKLVNRAQTAVMGADEEEAPAAPPKQEVLLEEIRDLLAKR